MGKDNGVKFMEFKTYTNLTINSCSTVDLDRVLDVDFLDIVYFQGELSYLNDFDEAQKSLFGDFFGNVTKHLSRLSSTFDPLITYVEQVSSNHYLKYTLTNSKIPFEVWYSFVAWILKSARASFERLLAYLIMVLTSLYRKTSPRIFLFE